MSNLVIMVSIWVIFNRKGSQGERSGQEGKTRRKDEMGKKGKQ